MSNSYKYLLETIGEPHVCAIFQRKLNILGLKKTLSICITCRYLTGYASIVLKKCDRLDHVLFLITIFYQWKKNIFFLFLEYLRVTLITFSITNRKFYEKILEISKYSLVLLNSFDECSIAMLYRCFFIR